MSGPSEPVAYLVGGVSAPAALADPHHPVGLRHDAEGVLLRHPRFDRQPVLQPRIEPAQLVDEVGHGGLALRSPAVSAHTPNETIPAGPRRTFVPLCPFDLYRARRSCWVCGGEAPHIGGFGGSAPPINT